MRLALPPRSSSLPGIKSPEVLEILSQEEKTEELVFNPEALSAVVKKAEETSLPLALLKERAGPTHIARTIADVLHNSGRDLTRLRAAELAANLGGLSKTADTSTISIIIQDSNVNLNSLFCPPTRFAPSGS
jgi:hypothetical protein